MARPTPASLLGTLGRTSVLVAALTWSAGCADLTAPALEESASPAAAPDPTPAPAPTPPQPRAPRPPKPAGERVKASHILIQYAGSARSRNKRSKADARKLTEKIAAEARSGKDFAELAKKYSEGPSKTRGGDLGYFGRGRMAKPFEKASFDLKPGEVSGVVETQFGFHVIKRFE